MSGQEEERIRGKVMAELDFVLQKAGAALFQYSAELFRYSDI